LGVAGIVLGFALQSTIANIFGGIQLIIDQSFRKGDMIKAGTDILGIVQDVGIRSTRVLTPDNELLIIPNGQLSNMVVQNFAQPGPKARVIVDFSVEYGADVKKVKEIIEKELSKLKDVLTPSKNPDTYLDVVFVQMAESSLNFQARFFVDHYNKRLIMKDEATNIIYETLRKNKIGIPFPTRIIYMKKDE
jgi:MscS family membrane protein